MKMKTALISVSDGRGLPELAREMRRQRIDIYATGGTLTLLKKNKIPARSVTELTGYPELLGGRLKTLHPKVHGGLLFLRSDPAQRRDAKKHGIRPIDLVVVNLYPFRQTVQKPRVTLQRAVEQIDIGGPTMLRSGSKNFESVTVLCDPADYSTFAEELRKGKGSVSLSLRRALALKAFRHTSAYDREIARYLSSLDAPANELPENLDVVYERRETLRYGENPHQRAALYRRRGEEPRFSFEQLHGKELSYNNILDFEAAVETLREFREPAACVVKHTNPCGIAADRDLATAAARAIEADSLSAFGGIVGVNQTCDEKVAKTVLDQLPFFEIIVAPQFAARALSLLRSRVNLRIMLVPNLYQIGPFDMRFVKSGVLVQDRDRPISEHLNELKKKLHWVTQTKLETKEELDQIVFAWKCAKVVRSNAIVLTQGKQTVGIGGGQMSRVDSVKLACMKAGPKTRGSILASDGFIPMSDNVEVAHEHGVRAIVQPGGSIRDQDVIDASNRFGIAMAFTGERHFKHG